MSQGGALSGSGGGGSGVTSVTGTTNRITAIPTTGAVVVDIASTYIGQTSITTLGTITTGTWNGSVIGPTFGGTGQSTYATGDMLYASGTTTLSKLNLGLVGSKLVVDDSGLPEWNKNQSGTDIVIYEDDFIYCGNMSGKFGIWDGGRSDNDIRIYQLVQAGHPGCAYVGIQNQGNEASIVANQGYLFNGDEQNFYIGEGYIHHRMIINIPILSDGTDNILFYFGFAQEGGVFSSPPGNNAIYFSYDIGTSTEWRAYTRSSGSSTLSSGTFPTVTTGWHTLEFTINAAASLVTFYIDGNLIGTSSTNIPVSAGMSMFHFARKTLGSTIRMGFLLDYVRFYEKLTTSRF